MIRRFVFLCLALLLVAGCESIFGKESGVRGALPGKRESIFSAERALKPDADAKVAAVDIPIPSERADWPLVGGSLTRAHGNIVLSQSPAPVWSTSIGEGSGGKSVLVAQPVVGGGKIFATDGTANVVALSTSDGKVMWQRSVPNPRPEDADISGSGLAYVPGKLVVTTSYGNVVALDPANGRILWQKMMPAPIRGAPVVDEGRVYVTSTANVVYDLALADGALGWTHAGVEETASLLGMAAPMPYGELVIVPYSSGQIAALRKLNGGMVWEENLASTTPTEGTLPAMSDIQGEPVIQDGKLYAASHSGRLVVLDARSGQRVWETDAGSTEMPWLAGKTLFIVTTENQLAALSTEDGRVRWSVDLPRYADPENRIDPIIWTGPVMAGGRLWVANSLGELHSYDPHNGKETSNSALNGPVYIAPLVANRTLYILSDDGTLTAFR
ncbi:MAG: PQQ-binding-like beta-propeller repeat protein [Proteobacteria bacterium]|nr:PQQ-binding-like beta-propeller repeat protein [Pseudomonadota bacterium]